MHSSDQSDGSSSIEDLEIMDKSNAQQSPIEEKKEANPNRIYIRIRKNSSKELLDMKDADSCESLMKDSWSKSLSSDKDKESNTPKWERAASAMEHEGSVVWAMEKAEAND